MDVKILASLIDAVPDQTKVFDSDLAALEKDLLDQQDAAVASRQATLKTPKDLAIEGVAHHVFNKLRGPQPSLLEQMNIPDATFDDILNDVRARF